MVAHGSVAQVVLDSQLPQLDHLFDYAIPPALHGRITVGSLVKVPLRGKSRITNAYVVNIANESTFAGTLAEVAEVVSDIPLLPRPAYDLARAIADRQVGTAADVIRLIIPARYVRTERSFFEAQSAPAAITHVPLVESHPDALLPQQGGMSAITVVPRVTSSDGLNWIPEWAEQMAMQAQEVLSQKKSSILVVPDYRDIEFLVQALELRGLADFTVRVDAKLSGSARYRNFLRALTESNVVVVGNRSAALTPVCNLGLISMWDDGDDAYIERLAPYAHTRDIVLIRQSISKCGLTFLSHCLSTELQRLVDIDFLPHISMNLEKKPRIVPTDLSSGAHVPPTRIPSQAIQAAREACKKGPVLIQVAQPGFAPVVACKGCHEIARCQGCAGPLKLAQVGAPPVCRWCARKAINWICPHCSVNELKPISSGSDRTAQELGKAFPGVKVVVSDGDHPIIRVPQQPMLVIATPGAEPLAAGGYACVLLLDGDRLRTRESLRVVENLLRVWANTISFLAKEATCYVVGTGEKLGTALATWSFEPVIAQELAERATLGLPPARRLVSLEGPLSLVTQAVNVIERIPDTRLLGKVPSSEDSVRAIVSFSFRSGMHIARELRAQVISATALRASQRGRQRTTDSVRMLRLKVHMDYPAIDMS